MVRARSVLIAVLCTVSAGCATQGDFLEDGSFRQPRIGYVVGAAGASAGVGDLLGPSWALRSHLHDIHNTPTRRKTDDRWMVDIAFDANADGEPDFEARMPRYDLLYEHRRVDARLWLQTVPVTSMTIGKDLSTLIERYAQGMSGGSYVWNLSESRASDVRVAAKILSMSPTTVAGRPALSADIELANLDQVKLDPNARSRRLRVTVLRTGVYYFAHAGDVYGPSLLIIVFSSAPDDFDTEVAAHTALLERISFPPPAG